MWLRKFNKAGNQRSAPPNSAQMIIDSSLFTVGMPKCRYGHVQGYESVLADY